METLIRDRPWALFEVIGDTEADQIIELRDQLARTEGVPLSITDEEIRRRAVEFFWRTYPEHAAKLSPQELPGEALLALCNEPEPRPGPETEFSKAAAEVRYLRLVNAHLANGLSERAARTAALETLKAEESDYRADGSILNGDLGDRIRKRRERSRRRLGISVEKRKTGPD